jgi:anti-sigma regulatory factor (Ser/Thr protein kinase)
MDKACMSHEDKGYRNECDKLLCDRSHNHSRLPSPFHGQDRPPSVGSRQHTDQARHARTPREPDSIECKTGDESRRRKDTRQPGRCTNGCIDATEATTPEPRQRTRQKQSIGVESQIGQTTNPLNDGTPAACHADRVLMHTSDTVHVELPAVPQSAARARQLVENTLRAREVDAQIVETAVLLTSELITNAIMHTNHGPLTLDVGNNGIRIRISVGDTSSELPSVAPLNEETEHGRGLWLVQILADHWGAQRHHSSGKSVWFELAADQTGSSYPSVESGWETSTGNA